MISVFFFPVNPNYDCAELNLKQGNEEHRGCIWLSMMPAVKFFLSFISMIILIIYSYRMNLC